MIYCDGKEAEVVPVVIAKTTASGALSVARQRPLYHVCSECGEVLPERMAVR